MKLKYLVQEDFINYKVPSMFIGTTKCTMKCGSENCQNFSLLTSLKDLEISSEKLCKMYLDNPISEAIVFGGLEPFDTFYDLIDFISVLRNKFLCSDSIIIYTGYTEEEITSGKLFNGLSCEQNQELFQKLISFKNITIKYGRYIANDEPHLDELLGVKLASKNQYAVHYN